jgi:aspartate aminotransferase
MSAKISSRLSSLPVSSVRKLTPYAVDAKKSGIKILHLNIGDPDIKTPEVMIDVLRNWSINPIRYAQSNGEPHFIKAMLSYYARLGFTDLSEKEIIATVGGSEAVNLAFYSVCAPGEEILVFEPFYSNYASCAHYTGINLVAVPAGRETNFHLPSKEEIEKKITDKTKAILYCSPGNPTGAVFSKEEVELLVEIAKEHNLFLISDEVYREYIFEGEHTSLLSYINEIPGNAILLDSLSKRYSLCGARLGVIVSKNEDLIKGIVKLAQTRLSGGLIDQEMASKMGEVPDSYIDGVREEYKKRRDVLYEGLTAIEGVEMSVPEGAFYTMVTLPAPDAEDFAIFLLKEFRIDNETVMVAPGQGFYSTPEVGKSQVRIAYVLNTEDLKRAINIIKLGLEQYRKIKAI